jgi:hypothetical protein
MLDIDRVWSRVAQLDQFRGKKLSDFIYQGITYFNQLTSGQAVANQPVLFPSGAILIGAGAGATIDNAVATQTNRPGLDLFKIAIANAQDNRNIVGTNQALAYSVYGPFGDQWPAKEIVISVGGGLVYAITNMTLSTIDVFITHHCLVPGAQV